MWSKMELKISVFLRFLVFLAQSGPTGLPEWILRAKMEPERSKWEAKVDPMAMPIAASKNERLFVTMGS